MGYLPFTSSGSVTGAVLIGQLFQKQIVDAIYNNGFLGTVLPNGQPLFSKTMAGGDTAAR